MLLHQRHSLCVDPTPQLRICFTCTQMAGLKVNTAKCSFGLKEIPYPGCIVSRDGIKPNPKKIQGIMDLDHPKTMTEVKSLVGMVQYLLKITVV